MSNTENTVQSVGFKSIERDEEKVKGLALDSATMTHFNSVKDALMEVAKADAQKTHGASLPKAKNSMITTFKIMKIVMETLRESSDSSKETNKLIKKEWKAVSDKQSANNLQSKENINGNQNWQLMAVMAGQVHTFASIGVSNGWHTPLGKALGHFDQNGWFKMLNTFGANLQGLSDGKEVNLQKGKEWAENAIKDSLQPLSGSLSKGASDFASAMTQAEQYNLGTKDSLFQHEVQTHTSEYQNTSQQQTSDKQAVDNASDTAKQLIRAQGEILMGKAG